MEICYLIRELVKDFYKPQVYLFISFVYFIVMESGISVRIRGGYFMAKADELTFTEFSSINSRLRQVSDTWADLWITIYYTKISVGKLLVLRFEDVTESDLPLKNMKLFNYWLRIL